MLTPLQTVLRRAPLGLLAAAVLVLAVALPTARAEEMPYGQGLLWRVQKDGGPASYVLGTIHSTDPRLRRLSPEIGRAIANSRVMAFELLESQEGAARMARALPLPPQRHLEDILEIGRASCRERV